MGLLSSIGGALKSAATKVLSPVVNNEANPIHVALDTLQTVISHPIKSVEAIVSPSKSFSELKTTTTSGSVKKQITETVLGTAGLAAATVATGYVAGAVATKGVAQTAASLIPKTTKGKVVAAFAAVPVTTAVISNPIGTAKTVTNVLDAQVDLGKTLANPSLESAKEFVSEHPIATAVAGVATVAAVGGGIGLAANTVATYLNTKATNQNTEPVQIAESLPKETAAAKETTMQPAAEAALTPVTPATTNVYPTKTSSQRKKRSSKPVMQNFKQQVSVIVSNRGNSTTKNYLKREVLIH